MKRNRTTLLRVFAACLAVTLGACAAGAPKKSTQYVEQPVETLYNHASDLLDKRQWTQAAEAYQEVERQHPYSSWARRATLMTAYAQYQGNKYEEAVGTAQRFIGLHPGNASAPYAYYLIAICSFEQILDVGRDQQSTENALISLTDVVKRFPESVYARDARIKIDMVNDQLAGKEMDVGRFYLRHNLPLSAINRFRLVVENKSYQTTSHTPEALHRLVEAYLTVGMVDQAQRAAAFLGYNFPGNPWYQRTYELMNEKGVPILAENEAKRRGWLSRTMGRIF